MARRTFGFLVDSWKRYTLKLVKRRFGNGVDLKKVENYLDHLVTHELKVPKTYWVNNYKRAVVSTDLLAAIQSVVDSGLIIGGAATTYIQHHVLPNPFRQFIMMLRDKRSDEKHVRDTFERGVDDEWERYNRKQNNTKIVTNSLYGVLGYAKFIFYNVFLAEAITRMGRVIIATASTGFENFLCDNICLCCESEVYEYIGNIMDEYDEKWTSFNFGALGKEIDVDTCVERILGKCRFKYTQNMIRHVTAIVTRVNPNVRFLLFYKNNFMEFNRIPIIRDKILRIIGGIDALMLPRIDKIEDPAIREEVEDLWKFYDACVFYNFPIYDNVRKMSYETRKGVLYIDTDSNFISLSRWVDQIQNEFMGGTLDRDYRNFVFTCANILTIFLSTVVDRNLKMFAKNCGISEEWRKYLSMKNEFFFWRILFGDVKKRYVDLQLIQEGKLLKDGKGIPEIKGYDFRKFSTKAIIRDYYTNLCVERILTPEHIDLKAILVDVFALKREVEQSMKRGESTYFKQANVSSPEHYADPLRISGIKGVMLWNALVPDNPIELPGEVDLIPIRNLQTAKMKSWLETSYPEIYQRLSVEIFNNRNPQIAKMTLNVIAKPRNDNIELPKWVQEAMDLNKITNSTIKLIHPVVESLGMKIQRPTKNKEFLTTIVDL